MRASSCMYRHLYWTKNNVSTTDTLSTMILVLVSQVSWLVRCPYFKFTIWSWDSVKCHARVYPLRLYKIAECQHLCICRKSFATKNKNAEDDLQLLKSIKLWSNALRRAIWRYNTFHCNFITSREVGNSAVLFCCSCCCHLSVAFLMCISSSKIKSLALILQIFGEYFVVTPTRLLQLQNDLLIICLLYMPILPAIIVTVNVRCTGLDSVRSIWCSYNS